VLVLVLVLVLPFVFWKTLLEQLHREK